MYNIELWECNKEHNNATSHTLFYFSYYSPKVFILTILPFKRVGEDLCVYDRDRLVCFVMMEVNNNNKYIGCYLLLEEMLWMCHFVSSILII